MAEQSSSPRLSGGCSSTATATTGTPCGGGAVMRWRMCSMATRSVISGWSVCWTRSRCRRPGGVTSRRFVPSASGGYASGLDEPETAHPGPTSKRVPSTDRWDAQRRLLVVLPGDEAGEQLDDLLLPAAVWSSLPRISANPVSTGGGGVGCTSSIRASSAASRASSSDGLATGERIDRPRACARVTTRRASAVVRRLRRLRPCPVRRPSNGLGPRGGPATTP